MEDFHRLALILGEGDIANTASWLPADFRPRGTGRCRIAFAADSADSVRLAPSSGTGGIVFPGSTGAAVIRVVEAQLDPERSWNLYSMDGTTLYYCLVHELGNEGLTHARLAYASSAAPMAVTAVSPFPAPAIAVDREATLRIAVQLDAKEGLDLWDLESAEPYPLNLGAQLDAGSLYLFEVPAYGGSTWQFRVGGACNVTYLRVLEAGNTR